MLLTSIERDMHRGFQFPLGLETVKFVAQVQIKKPNQFNDWTLIFGSGDWIRTSDLVVAVTP